MIKLAFTWSILFFLLSFHARSQEEEQLHSVYFDFDKHLIKPKEQNSLLDFIQSIDTSAIDAIEILGYCDDRGKADYNFILSEKRATAIQKFIVNQGITNKVIVHIEGKGRVMIDQDYAKDLSRLRQKNRRVDVVLNFKNLPFQQQPGVYTELRDSLIPGDRIVLQHLQFDQGSSKLTSKARRELKKIAKKLAQNSQVHFEVHGHICCTPKRYREAYDKHTKRRELSQNRALQVYQYLLQQRIDPTRMKHMGCGNEYPLNLTPDLDRRVELYIIEKD